MRGMVFKGNCEVEVMNFADPVPGPGEAIIEIKASGMCGTDLHYYRHGMAEALDMLGMRSRMTSDVIIGGHEPCGVIAEIGPGSERGSFRKGDRVIVFHYDGCSTCEHCRSGWTQLCDQGAKIYGVLGDGGHANYMKVPVTSLVHLPADVSFKGGAAIACGTGTAYGALQRLDISARDTLAVYGLGPVGLSVAQMAAAMGVEVLGVDINAERVAQSKRFGVAHAIDASTSDPIEEIHKLTTGRGVSCSIDCAGGPIPRAQAIRSTRTWGRTALVAVGGELKIDVMRDLIGKQRNVIGSFTLSETAMDECARFIASHGVKVDDLFTSEWRLEQANEAYADFNKQASGKGVFLF
ncbi:iditol 2-dehydrogenase [Stenotrophomonas maltophilia]|uniref:zinc-dependent alcohol dehydrogenase family protein n=2 Tax=Stenotrophomonas maltophilia TaxID=40324 RepID=UPI0015DDBC88|nr:zinc-binding dehydrogenase [Stenotrophomonas maltophilia]MBA0279761.1 iditol 2-dehydrogenase [Stenotrophomonas maltophilia]MBA0346472.1 iditol 2-dehydrogenase [Stenotrophomonas maltophilia]MBA0359846.1 iditol 2-dehydrogenase [Stenotrophomonas maltophilia]MBA0518441.1 iditol 2-dehydrogenase [Stenotrophomonas maltophilia]